MEGGESFISECQVSFPRGPKSVDVSVLIYPRERIALGNGKITFQATLFNLFELALERDCQGGGGNDTKTRKPIRTGVSP